MWISVLWAGLRVAMWITHVGGKYHHGLLEKSEIFLSPSIVKLSDGAGWKVGIFSSVFLPSPLYI